MRQGNNGRRARGGRPNRRNGPLKAQTFDSNGPEVRIRGNAHQVHEKYTNLVRDATSAGDRVLAESYAQYAEHYYRIINESTDPDSPGTLRKQNRPQRDERGMNGYDQDGDEDDFDGDEDEGGQPYVERHAEQPRERRAQDEESGRAGNEGRRNDRRRNGNDAQDQGQRANTNGNGKARPESNAPTSEGVEAEERDGLERTLRAKPRGEAEGEEAEAPAPAPARRPRGRPRKNAAPVDDANNPRRRAFPAPPDEEGAETPSGGDGEASSENG